MMLIKKIYNGTQRQQRNRKRGKAGNHFQVLAGAKNKSVPFWNAFTYYAFIKKDYLLPPFVSLSRSNIRLKRSVLDNGF